MEKLVTWPASRLQILGAEEAFRRAKKTGSKMPKHGSIIVGLLIFLPKLLPGAGSWDTAISTAD